MSSELVHIHKTTHSTGLRIITESIDSVRSLSVGIWVKTGSRHEKTNIAGITHFLEHMLFKGTSSRSAFEIVHGVESVGGYLNAFTSSEYTCYYVRCLDSELRKSLDILIDMVQHAALPPDEIEKELGRGPADFQLSPSHAEGRGVYRPDIQPTSTWTSDYWL